jgi:hypothetical protein
MNRPPQPKGGAGFGGRIDRSSADAVGHHRGHHVRGAHRGRHPNQATRPKAPWALKLSEKAATNIRAERIEHRLRRLCKPLQDAKKLDPISALERLGRIGDRRPERRPRRHAPSSTASAGRDSAS